MHRQWCRDPDCVVKVEWLRRQFICIGESQWWNQELWKNVTFPSWKVRGLSTSSCLFFCWLYWWKKADEKTQEGKGREKWRNGLVWLNQLGSLCHPFTFLYPHLQPSSSLEHGRNSFSNSFSNSNVSHHVHFYNQSRCLKLLREPRITQPARYVAVSGDK